MDGQPAERATGGVDRQGERGVPELVEPGCDLCNGFEVHDFGTGVIAVAAARPTNDLDLWLGPREHVRSILNVDSTTRAAWLAAVKWVIGRWRANRGSDGVNVFAYVGSLRPDWPAHVALRIIGRRAVEAVNPVHVFNRSEIGASTPEDQRAALLDTSSPVEPQRWNLTIDEQLRTCMSCVPSRLEQYLIADIDAARLFQHGGAIDVGMLITCPIRHAERFEDIDAREFDSLVTMADLVGSMFRSSLGADGLWFAFNDGLVAGQETPHVHVHLWARGATDATNPFADGLPPMVGRPTADQVRSLRNRASDAFALVRDGHS